LKLDGNGAYKWHTFWGGLTSCDFATGIALDGDGNIYLAGHSTGTWQGPASTNPKHPDSGGRDIFALMLNSNAEYQWHTFYGSTADEWSSNLGLAICGDDSLYIGGYGATTWQGDGATAPKHPHSSSGTAFDMAILKLSGDGIYQWHTFYGSTGVDNPYGVAADDSCAVYVTGNSNTAWVGDASANPKHAYSGGVDLTVLKLDASGAYQWHTFYGSGGGEGGVGIAVNAGGVYVTGPSGATWQGSAGQGPIHPHSSGTNADISVLVLDQDGAYQWHTFYGSTDDDRGNSIAADETGNIHIAGSSKASWQGDNNANPKHAHSGGGSFYDLAVLKLQRVEFTNAVYLPFTKR